MRAVAVNLASEPIEGRRLRRRMSWATAVLVGGLTVAHVALASWVAETPPVPRSRPEAVAQEVARWQQEVARLEAYSDPLRVRAVVDAVAVANEMIAQRRFPWISFFLALEAALPDDVRLELVQPVVSGSGVRVELVAASGSRESLLAFLGALERMPELREVLPTSQQIGEDGQVRLGILARHAGSTAGANR